ncbi:hypothetical protein RvY_05678 [Ramazzottius varieornatus]|uniref:Fucosyltransferase n=1 Tax=Ramazzottius varieornatus TaxID=947166 RepID=A0A1D1V4U7_RAMVA|nr:hypothetical protein RvY_05678 [Ramazzottius varieornatus]
MIVDLDNIPVRSNKRYRLEHRGNEADNEDDIDNYLMQQSYGDLDQHTTMAKMQRRDRSCLWFVLFLTAVFILIFFLVRSRPFDQMFHSMSSPPPPKLILIWDRRTPFMDVKPYRLKKELPRSSLQAVSAGCNCEITSDTAGWQLADVVVVNAFYLRRLNDLGHFFPRRRNRSQLWVFYMLEPAQIMTENRDRAWFGRLNGQFNLTMTYRLDSDVPIGYGKLRPFYADEDPQIYKDFGESKKYMVAWFVSNCRAKSGRLEYVKELQKHIPVDIYGDCGTMKCPNATTPNCNTLLRDHYKFYLSFESSVCKDYITEKFFGALQNDVVPIVIGGGNYTAINAPSNSYIDARDFTTPKDLADYLFYLEATPGAYNEYFQWKEHWRVERRGVYSHSLCELCRRINEIAAEPSTSFHQIYVDMMKWWHQDGQCKHGQMVNGTWSTE